MRKWTDDPRNPARRAPVVASSTLGTGGGTGRLFDGQGRQVEPSPSGEVMPTPEGDRAYAARIIQGGLDDAVYVCATTDPVSTFVMSAGLLGVTAPNLEGLPRMYAVPVGYMVHMARALAAVARVAEELQRESEGLPEESYDQGMADAKSVAADRIREALGDMGRHDARTRGLAREAVDRD